uniref:BTB domain-containing protein n=1 Tax=Plectus sambesii TaxID=2011161 RepID=A0A914XR04_9BILA
MSDSENGTGQPQDGALAGAVGGAETADALSASSSSSLETRKSVVAGGFGACGGDLACGSEFVRPGGDFVTSSPPIPGEPKTEGSIKLNISNLSALRHKVTTSFHTIASLPWRLAAKTECSKRTNNIKFFSVYIDCNPESESTLWSCEALVEFRLIGQKSAESAPFSRQFTNKFNYNSNNWGFPSFMEWSDILNPEKGFIKGDRVIVEARITVQKTRGVRSNPSFDFTIPQQHISDGVLVVDGVRLHVSKAYLSLYSPVFHALFFAGFRERVMDEIPVEDVILEEFMELLHVIYPSHKAITAENVEFLLELGDKFEMQFVIDECEKFLKRSEEIPIVTKLVWADQYCLA